MSNDETPKDDVDDLLSALDDWDAAFDSLHDDAESAESIERAKEIAQREAAMAAEQPALFRSDESDFGELNFDGEPKALGEMLGPSPLPLPGAAAKSPPAIPKVPAIPRVPAIEEEEVFTSAPRHDASSATVLPAGPTDDELFGDLPAEVDVAAIASVARSGGDATRVADPDAALLAAIEAGEAGEGDSIDIAPEATRVASPEGALLELAARESVASAADSRPAPRGPAIVRRDTVEPRPAEPDDSGDFGSDFAAGESTRVADLGQVSALLEEQARANAAAQAFFSDDAPAVSLELDEDFYADIEIGDTGSSSPIIDASLDAESGDDAGASVRRTAHTVRRAPVTTSTVEALAPADDNGVVYEFEAEDDEDYAPPKPATTQSQNEMFGAVSSELEVEEPAFGVADSGTSASQAASAVELDFSTPSPGEPDLAADVDVFAKRTPEPRPTLDVELSAGGAVVVEAAEAPFELPSFDLDVELGLAGASEAEAATVDIEVDVELGAAGGSSEFDEAPAPAAPVQAARIAPPLRTTPPMIGRSESPAIEAEAVPVIEAEAVPVIEAEAVPVIEAEAVPVLEGEPVPAVEAPAVAKATPVSIAEEDEVRAAALGERDLEVVDVTPEVPASTFADILGSISIELQAIPEAVEPITTIDEDLARLLLVFERELESVDDAGGTAALRIEAGRLSERLDDPDRAVHHYEAALLADPSRRAARRGLRRALRRMGRFDESVAHAAVDSSAMSETEATAFASHHLDLLLASNEFDVARVQVGELLDQNPADTAALLADMGLSYVDSRDEELDLVLSRLSAASGDAAMGASLAMLRTRFAAGRGGGAQSDAPDRLAQVASDSSQAFALALFLRRSAASDSAEFTAATASLAAASAGLRGAICARELSAGRALPQGIEADSVSGDAFLAWSRWRMATTPAAQISALESLAQSAEDDTLATWALTEAGQLARAEEPARADALYAVAAERQPADPYLAWCRAQRALDQGDLVAGYDGVLAVTPDDVRARVRRANLAATSGGDISAGLAILDLASSTSSVVVALDRTAYAFATGDESRAIEVLGAAGSAGLLDSALARIAVARAADAEVAQNDDAATDHSVLVARALDAWQRVLELDNDMAEAHAASLRLAGALGDPAVIEDVLEKMQRAVPSPTRAVGIALRRARLAAASQPPDLSRAEDLARDAAAIDAADPRVLATLAGVLAKEGRWTDYAAALEERAQRVGEGEAFALRYRAGALLIAHGEELDRAVESLSAALETVPGFVMADELIQSARRMQGEAPTLAPANSFASPDKLKAQGADGFARLVRSAEASFAAGDAAAAVDEYRRALALRAQDPLARGGFERAAEAAGEAALLAATALDDLRAAEEGGDQARKADAYELLARVDGQLRNDEGSATMAKESALAADPTRISVSRDLWRVYAREQRSDDMITVAQSIAAQLAGSRDALSWAHDLARLETARDRRNATVEAYRTIIEIDPSDRLALVHLERLARETNDLERAVELSLTIAAYFSPDRGGDSRAAGAFMTRAGELLTDLGRTDDALNQFRAAAAEPYRYRPAMVAWQQTALGAELWLDAAAAAEAEAAISSDDGERVALHHLAGVIYMDRALDGERAVPCFRRVLALEPTHLDAFVRLRMLFEEQGDHEDLAQLLSQRLERETDLAAKIELLRSLADQHRNFLDDRDEAKRNLRELLTLWPSDRVAIAALSDICWEQGAWAEAAEALIARARVEVEPAILKAIYYRLGTIYAERLPNPAWAIKSFERVLSIDAHDEGALRRLAELGVQTKDWNLALGASDRLLKVESDPDAKVAHLHRIATIFREGFNDRPRAERAIRSALEVAPTNAAALDALIVALREAGDQRALRIELDKVCQAMRSILADSPTTELAYHVIARAMAARENAGGPGSVSVARCAAELAVFAGSSRDDDRQLAASASSRVGISGLARTEVDDILFPRVVSAELRQLFHLLGDRVGKHVGIDLRGQYGVGRGERRKGSNDVVGSTAREIGAELGFDDIDVYVSASKPSVVAAEPTSPVSLIIGTRFATEQTGPALRFACARSLKLAQVGLAIPARMPVDAFGTLLFGLLRQFQADLEPLGLDADEVANQQNKLRRLIPTQLLTELRPYALNVIGAHLDHKTIWNGIQAAGNRAGLLAGGSVAAGMAVAAGDREGLGLAAAAADPVLADLLRFSVSADHARLRELLS